MCHSELHTLCDHQANSLSLSVSVTLPSFMLPHVMSCPMPITKLWAPLQFRLGSMLWQLSKAGLQSLKFHAMFVAARFAAPSSLVMSALPVSCALLCGTRTHMLSMTAWQPGFAWLRHEDCFVLIGQSGQTNELNFTFFCLALQSRACLSAPRCASCLQIQVRGNVVIVSRHPSRSPICNEQELRCNMGDSFQGD